MVMNLVSIIVVTILFVLVMVIFSTEKIDFLAIALFAALISAFILIKTYVPASGENPIGISTFIGMIDFQPLIFIFGMQIVIAVAEEQKIFQYVAIQAIQLTKGNDRVLFYLICLVSTLTAAVVADVTVAIIFAPLIIRTCRILEIQPAPYLFGMTICINIGSLITPFSSAENIIIAGNFANYGVDATWFASNLMIFGLVLLGVTTFLLDRFMLRKNERVNPDRKSLVRDILVPSVIIEEKNKKRFYMNVIFLIVIFAAFFFTPDAYIVALIGSIAMVLANRRKLGEFFKKVEWEVIFFFASLYIIIGVMIKNGTIGIIDNFINTVIPDNILAISIFILIMSSIFSGFLANSPTALMFLAIIDGMIATHPSIAANPNPLIIALLIGINLGGNFLPQGAACDVMTLTIATRNKVKGFNFKTLTKNGAIFAFIHMCMGILFLVFYCLVII